jgi:hypothetical protein
VTKLTWPAPERNKQPIFTVLQRVLPDSGGTMLELASGTGQHAAFFAEHLPDWTFQPSEVDPANLASISARVREASLPNLREPLSIDVSDEDWPIGRIEAIYNANLVHIAPWDVAVALLRGAGRHLRRGGMLTIYGPFRIGGLHTAPSNQAFDEDLKRRDPTFGVRDLEAVLQVAQQHGLSLQERIEMPANNQFLVLVHD